MNITFFKREVHLQMVDIPMPILVYLKCKGVVLLVALIFGLFVLIPYTHLYIS